jgi:hypothetical protein
VTDQSSIIRFIEDNRLGGVRIGHGSFDTIANLLTQMFNFLRFRSNGVLFLNPNTGGPIAALATRHATRRTDGGPSPFFIRVAVVLNLSRGRDGIRVVFYGRLSKD